MQVLDLEKFFAAINLKILWNMYKSHDFVSFCNRIIHSQLLLDKSQGRLRTGAKATFAPVSFDQWVHSSRPGTFLIIRRGGGAFLKLGAQITYESLKSEWAKYAT